MTAVKLNLLVNCSFINVLILLLKVVKRLMIRKMRERMNDALAEKQRVEDCEADLVTFCTFVTCNFVSLNCNFVTL